MNFSVYKLRKRHPRFIYHEYKFDLVKDGLRFSFDFEIEPNIHFSPQIEVKGISQDRLQTIGKDVLNNFAFHLGLMEIPSYWKASCSPEIIVSAGQLDEFQQIWWKDLLIRGMAEFFFVNQIDFTAPDFLTFKTDQVSAKRKKVYAGDLDKSRIFVPVAGGKDSALSCELLKRGERKIIPFCLNPTKATLNIIQAGKIGDPIVANRRIDERLLKLNKIGYLNGHTPFSAYLAFLSAITSVLFETQTVLVSNERSSNEGNAILAGVEINHQYSKSYEFEIKFRQYCKKYLVKNLEFSSFLRPLYELQIAKIFSRFPTYFSLFKSCNVGQKTDSWCQKCAKCLFVFTILYPFVEEEILCHQIFSENLFSKREFIALARKFLGGSEIKPFDCVGTKEETMVAFFMCLEKAKRSKEKLPPVLQAVEAEIMLKQKKLEKRKQRILSAWNKDHSLTKDLELLLKKEANI